MAKNQFIRARVAGWEKDCIRRKADAAHMTRVAASVSSCRTASVTAWLWASIRRLSPPSIAMTDTLLGAEKVRSFICLYKVFLFQILYVCEGQACETAEDKNVPYRL